MFVIQYFWAVRPGKEKDFEKAWATLCEEVIQHNSMIGGRLHRTEDGSYIGYSEWKTKGDWELAGKNPFPNSASKEAIAACIQSTNAIYMMNVVSDLL